MNTSAAVQLSFHLVLAFRESAKMSSREGRLSVGDAATASRHAHGANSGATD